MKIYCIGDSHSLFFSGYDSFIDKSCIPLFKSYNIGPALAYNLQKEHSSTQGRQKLFNIINTLKKGDMVFLSFGSVDCCFHLEKQAKKQQRKLKDVTEECVNEYIKTIIEIKNRGLEIIVWGVVAGPKDPYFISYNAPIYNDEPARNKMREYFNNYLEKKLLNLDVVFISIFKDLIDKNYYTQVQYYKDQTHINQKAMSFFIRELKKKKILSSFDWMLFVGTYYVISRPMYAFDEFLQYLYYVSSLLKKKYFWYESFLIKIKRYFRNAP